MIYASTWSEIYLITTYWFLFLNKQNTKLVIWNEVLFKTWFRFVIIFSAILRWIITVNMSITASNLPSWLNTTCFFITYNKSIYAINQLIESNFF